MGGSPLEVILMPNRVLVVLVAFTVSSAAAQEPAAVRPSYARAVWAEPVSREAREPLGGFLGPGDEDHRYAGFFVAAGLGLAATLTSVSWCEDQDSGCSSSQALLVGTAFAIMAGFAGAVIGGLIPKTP